MSGVLRINLLMCVCPSSLGVSIQWESTAYRASEDSGTAELVLLKEGETTFNASVTVTTMTATASSKYISYIHQSIISSAKWTSAIF